MASYTNETMTSFQVEVSIMEESLNVMKSQSALMKLSMGSGSIRDVFKYAAVMVAELRTSALTPIKYCELYVQVIKGLQALHTYVSDLNQHKRSLTELYESVQHVGNVLPRLYLAITVAIVCIRNKELSGGITLLELSDLCKGIQHPLRGLFIRHYLLQTVTEHFPELRGVLEKTDTNSELDQVELLFKFLYNNCVETTKLWIRLHFQATMRKKTEKIKEDDSFFLRDFIGNNIFAIATLHAMTIPFYKAVVFPQILQHLYNIHDPATQQYLIECVIKAFDEIYLIDTLDSLMESLLSMNSAVDFMTLLKILLKRLNKYLLQSTLSQKKPTLEDINSTKQSSVIQESDEQMDENRYINQTSSFEEEDKPIHSNAFLEDSQSKPIMFVQDKSNFFEQKDKPSETLSSVDTKQLATRNEHPTTDAGVSQTANIVEVLTVHTETPPTSPSLSSAKRRSVTSANSYEKDFDVCAKKIFFDLKNGISNLIQKAHSQTFGARTLEITKRVQQPSKLTVENLLQILEGFLGFTVSVFPTSIEYSTEVYEIVSVLLRLINELENSEKIEEATPEATNKSISSLSHDFARSDFDKIKISSQIAELMAYPMAFANYMTLFSSQVYCEALNLLKDESKRLAFKFTCQKLIDSEQTIREYSSLEGLLKFGSTSLQSDSNEEVKTYKLVAAVIHLIQHEDTDEAFKLLCCARDYLLAIQPNSRSICLPALAFRSLELFTNIHKLETIENMTNLKAAQPETSDETKISVSETATAIEKLCNENFSAQSDKKSEGSTRLITSKRVLQFVHRICIELLESNQEIAFQIFLVAADAAGLSSSSGQYTAICCEFFQQAILCYEEYLTENKLKLKALTLFLATLLSSKASFPTETIEPFAEKLTRHASKLLRKAEQCLLILDCTHLFWDESEIMSLDSENEQLAQKTLIGERRVQECLQRCIKLSAESLQYSTNEVYLFVEVLEKYMFFFERVPQQFAAETISNLLSLCTEQIGFALGAGDLNKGVVRAQTHFSNVLTYIQYCQRHGLFTYSDVNLSCLKI